MSVPNSSPFAQAAMTYLAAGWCPLPLKGKKLLVKGWTGGHAYRLPSRSQLRSWIREYPKANIGLRIPPDVLGLDVDNYGDKAGKQTLRELSRELGALPPTWVTGARTDPVSGIRLFRVPAGLSWPGKAGPGIEIIQPRHRYIVVAPSVHPDTGASYSWRGGEAADEFPGAADFIELPKKWCEKFETGVQTTFGAPGALTTKGVSAWLSRCPEGPMCDGMRQLADTAVRTFEEDGNDGAHDYMTNAVWGMCKDAHNGCAGIADAFELVLRAFTRAVANRRTRHGIQSEWNRAVAGAIYRLQGPKIEECDCGKAEGWGKKFVSPIEARLDEIPDLTIADKKRLLARLEERGAL